MAETPDQQFPEASLRQHVFDMAQQVAIALGEIDNPVTRQRENNPQAARYIIDVISMLQDKTSGNCTDEESEYLSGVVAGLKTLYVQKTA